MAITLSDLILDVRAALSDLPEEYIDDPQIWKDLRRAKLYISEIKVDTVDEDVEKHCIILLARYYTYINYTSIAERQMGTAPSTTVIRVATLREQALAFLLLISKFKLNPDLTISSAPIGTTPGYGCVVAPSNLDEV